MAGTAHSYRYLELRQILTESRRKAGLTQAVLARRLGKPQSFVSKYECGERRLDFLELLDVAAAIGLDVSTLVRRFRR